MNRIAEQVLIAMADQGWAVVDHAEEGVRVYSPITGRRARLPQHLFVDATEDNLYALAEEWVGHIILLGYNGLIWPWPPEPDDLVKGSG